MSTKQVLQRPICDMHYGAVFQELGIVPIVEPEMLMEIAAAGAAGLARQAGKP